MLRRLIKTALFLIGIQVSHQEAPHRCPISFMIAYTKSGEEPICYRRKGPETFNDIYEDCVGNLYTSKTFLDLNITQSQYPLWTEYKTYYPGGLFIDRSNTRYFGLELNLTNFIIDSADLDEELCLVLDPVSHFTAVKCNAKHYRYCFVRPYIMRVSQMSREGCESFKDSWRFRSPESTCLTALEGVGGGAVRATWTQAKKLCSDKGGSLLYRGWRYANSPLLKNGTIPLGIIMSTDFTMLRYDATEDHSEIPPPKWNFAEKIHNAETLLGSQSNDYWYLVNCSFIFYEVVCERSVPLKNVIMYIAIDSENKLILTVNETLNDSDIACYTDSLIRYPLKVAKKRIGTNTYVLRPKKNGYYWCTHRDVTNYMPTVSNSALYVDSKRNVDNVYAIKFRQRDKYNIDAAKLVRDWTNKIRDYIQYKMRSSYTKVYEETSAKDKQVWLDMKVKRLYLDARTVLAHVTVAPDPGSVPPGIWEDLEILSMKSVYFCPSFDDVPTMTLGQSINSPGCRTHTCVGDFNDGVQWVTTAATADDCLRPHTTLENVLRFGVMASTLRSETIHEHENGSDESSEETSDPALQKNDYQLTSTTENFDTTNNTAATTNTILIPTNTTFITTDQPTTEPTTDLPTVECSEEVMPVTTPTLAPTTAMDIPVNTDALTTDTPVQPTTTAIPREEHLQQVLQDLDRLVNDTHIIMNDLDRVFDQVDVLLETLDDLEIPGQFLHLLDRLGSTVVLDNGTGSAIRPNIALLMADAQPNNPIHGFRIASSGSDVFTPAAFNFISQEPNTTLLHSDESEAVVYLPASVSQAGRRVSFVVFRNGRAFRGVRGCAVNSRVLSVNVENVTRFHGGEVIDIHLSPIVTELHRNESRACAYWHFAENGTGYWSQEGCTLIRATEEGMLDTCRCVHLTHFAEVLVAKTVFSEGNEDILEIITIVGCGLSLCGLIVIGVTALLFRSWRREYSNKVWLQLSIAIFVLVLSFLMIIILKFDNNNVPCMLIGVLLHYSVLASFCWMLVAAVLAYRRLVLVFTKEASHKLLKASAFAWGAPGVVVAILLSIAPHSYAGQFEEAIPSGSFCYPSGFSRYITVDAPITIVLLTNWILFALIIRSVFASRRIQRHGETNEALRCASVSCLLVFLFGLPWIFGLFAFNIVLAYMFTISATYQGFILFLFFVLGNKKTRDLWLNKLKIRQTRKVPVTSSTYTNRSAEWRPGHPHITLETKVSKPKVLSSKDESRFS